MQQQDDWTVLDYWIRPQEKGGLEAEGVVGEGDWYTYNHYYAGKSKDLLRNTKAEYEDKLKQKEKELSDLKQKMEDMSI
jgi:hypothetical protein